MIDCKQVTKRFGAVTALAPFDLEVASGEFIAIKGASGSGKTTLLLTLGGMLRPSDGAVNFDGSDLYAQSPATRADYRATEVGFVFKCSTSCLISAWRRMCGSPPAMAR